MYEILYADVPWAYNARKNKHTKFGQGMHRYPGMSVDKMCTYLEEEKIQVADNAALFFWTTCPKLLDPKHASTSLAGRVMEAWGFRFVTVAFTWVKTYHPSGKFFFGPGYYTASNVELCLLGIRGRMKPVSNYVSQLVTAPVGAHSAKPPEVRDRIVRLFGDRPRIELFARQRVPGWDALGNQLPELLTSPLDCGILTPGKY